MKDFNGKTVAITGGGSGIGFALAKQFGAEGARIVIGERRQERLDQAVARLKEDGIDAHAHTMDVTDIDSFERFADFAWSISGQVDVLVNNAGIALERTAVIEAPLEDVHTVFDVNFFGVWHGCVVFGRRMAEQGTPAAIYNVGSENSFFQSVPKSAGYYASKHAVRALTEALRVELPDFIEAGLICPGFVNTDIVAAEFAKFGMDADVFAAKVLEQMKDEQFYIVSHPYNMERIKPIHDEIEQAYARYAPRYEGDDEHDVMSVVNRLQQANSGE